MKQRQVKKKDGIWASVASRLTFMNRCMVSYFIIHTLGETSSFWHFVRIQISFNTFPLHSKRTGNIHFCGIYLSKPFQRKKMHSSICQNKYGTVHALLCGIECNLFLINWKMNWYALIAQNTINSWFLNTNIFDTSFPIHPYFGIPNVILHFILE